jgi:hypothetical protein
MMPLFARMTTRGKFVCGKTDEGIRSAQKIPARHNAAAMNVMDNACLVANRPMVEVWVMGAGMEALNQGLQTEE